MTGTIACRSSPTGAKVYYNDKLMNNPTNVNLIVPAGSHRIRFEKEGYKSFQTIAPVGEGETYTVSKTLVADTPTDAQGQITCISSPTGATVYYDGKQVTTKTNVNLTGVPPGNHTIKFTKSGYKDYQETRNVLPGIKLIYLTGIFSGLFF